MVSTLWAAALRLVPLRTREEPKMNRFSWLVVYVLVLAAVPACAPRICSLLELWQ